MRRLCALIAAMAGTASAQQYIMMPDSTADAIMLFDPFDGSLVDANYIDLTTSGIASTPVNANVVGNQIWVSDQLGDGIMRFDMAGNHLGNIVGGMDNIRGFEVVGNTVYVSNSGSNNGAPGDAVITIDVGTMSITGNFTVGAAKNGDPFDVLAFQNGFLINDIAGENIEYHDLSGGWVSNFHDSDGVSGIDFPEQMNMSLDGQSVFSAGFSSPSGIYEYDLAGNQINYYAVGSGLRGVMELGNGNIMFCDGNGVHVLNTSTGGVSDIVAASGRYFEVLVPAPSTLALIGFGGMITARRRR